MRIDAKKMRILLNAINESSKKDLSHLDKGLEVEHENGSKLTIVDIEKSQPLSDDHKGEVTKIVLKYYSTSGEKKFKSITPEEFIKLFKIDKKKEKKNIKGGKDDKRDN
jgi:hypothetical protein